MTMTKIRTALRNRFGDRGYRITKDGEVHYYEQNHTRPGWRWLGSLDEVISYINRGML